MKMKWKFKDDDSEKIWPIEREEDMLKWREMGREDVENMCPSRIVQQVLIEASDGFPTNLTLTQSVGENIWQISVGNCL